MWFTGSFWDWKTKTTASCWPNPPPPPLIFELTKLQVLKSITLNVSVDFRQMTEAVKLPIVEHKTAKKYPKHGLGHSSALQLQANCGSAAVLHRKRSHPLLELTSTHCSARLWSEQQDLSWFLQFFSLFFLLFLNFQKSGIFCFWHGVRRVEILSSNLFND